MSVRVRPFKGRSDAWEVDINVLLPGGARWRKRMKAPTSSRSAALRWGQAWERQILQSGPPKTRKEVPTLAEFAPRFLDAHARANRQKPSGIAAKETILRIHLVPALGDKKLDAIKSEDVQRLKLTLDGKSRKTMNNVLTVLNVLLKKAVEWEVIERMPCSVKLLPVARPRASFHDYDAYERLVEAARVIGWRTELIVLLGGDAGLRCGEMVALEWADIDFEKRQMCIRQSDWRGELTAPKGGRLRYVPLTRRLADALRQHRHLRSRRVLCKDDGRPLTRQSAWGRVRRAARRAEVPPGVHILRHTFCSHLAMRGAPTKAIQDLAGHQELSMTQRYMHLSPAALDAAIRLLEAPGTYGFDGDIVEAAAGPEQKMNA
jgi:integrase